MVDEELERIKRRMVERLIKQKEGGSWVDGKVLELAESSFDELLSKTEKPVLVDFWADWCLPCKMMKPVIEELAREYSSLAYFAKVNVDVNETLARKYGVMSIPNFIVFKKGRPVDRVIGAVGRSSLEAVLKRHVSE